MCLNGAPIYLSLHWGIRLSWDSFSIPNLKSSAMSIRLKLNVSNSLIIQIPLLYTVSWVGLFSYRSDWCFDDNCVYTISKTFRLLNQLCQALRRQNSKEWWMEVIWLLWSNGHRCWQTPALGFINLLKALQCDKPPNSSSLIYETAWKK